MITLDDIRAKLTRHYHGPARLLLDAIEKLSKKDRDYASYVAHWLDDPTASTVFLRDKVCAPFRNYPEIKEAGKQFNPTTEWDNTWMPLDTAMHQCRNPELYKE